MTADHPLLLWVAPAIGLALGVLAWLARRRRVDAAARWSAALAMVARATPRFGVPAITIAGTLAAVGLAGPRWGVTEIADETRALNLVIAVDISRSMLAEDAAPNRLGRAVREARRLLHDARGDRVALIAFAGRSYILTPLTLDEGAVQLQLDALDPDVASEGGTDLAAVLRQGAELLEAASEGGARALVVFTDGEAHDSIAGILSAARALRRVNATLVLVAEGGDAPTRIPIRDPRGTLVEFKTDAAGTEVFTSRRDDILRAVADAARGVLIPADFSDQAGAVWKTLAGLDRATAVGRRAEDQVPRAWVFALGAAVLLAAQAARRRAALLGLTLAALPAGAAAQRPAPGELRLARGDTARAVDAFSAAARAGGGDSSWYNAGTLALLARDYEAAAAALDAAAASLDPALRFRALYNRGLLALERARADSTPAERSRFEAEAMRAFREALLLEPGNASAKWNLELATRRQPPSGGGGSRSQPQQQQAPAPPSQSSESGLSRSEAEQILASVERAEQAVRADQLRRRRTATSAAAKDW